MRRNPVVLMAAMACAGMYVPTGADVIADVPRRQSTAPILTRRGESVNPIELHKLARKNARRRKRR